MKKFKNVTKGLRFGFNFLTFIIVFIVFLYSALVLIDARDPYFSLYNQDQKLANKYWGVIMQKIGLTLYPIDSE